MTFNNVPGPLSIIVGTSGIAEHDQSTTTSTTFVTAKRSLPDTTTGADKIIVANSPQEREIKTTTVSTTTITIPTLTVTVPTLTLPTQTYTRTRTAYYIFGYPVWTAKRSLPDLTTGADGTNTIQQRQVKTITVSTTTITVPTITVTVPTLTVTVPTLTVTVPTLTLPTRTYTRTHTTYYIFGHPVWTAKRGLPETIASTDGINTIQQREIVTVTGSTTTITVPTLTFTVPTLTFTVPTLTVTIPTLTVTIPTLTLPTRTYTRTHTTYYIFGQPVWTAKRGLPETVASTDDTTMVNGLQCEEPMPATAPVLAVAAPAVSTVAVATVTPEPVTITRTCIYVDKGRDQTPMTITTSGSPPPMAGRAVAPTSPLPASATYAASLSALETGGLAAASVAAVAAFIIVGGFLFMLFRKRKLQRRRSKRFVEALGKEVDA